MIRPLFFAAALAAVPAAAQAEAQRLYLDPNHTSIRVEWTHDGMTPLLIAFPAFSGEVHFDPDAIENSSVTVMLDMQQMWTGIPLWDDHLRDAERPLLQTAAYPEAKFVSTGVTRTGENTAALTGDLTIRDQTHEVTFDVEFTREVELRGQTVRGFLARAVIDRAQFGVEQGAARMGTDVTIVIATELMENDPG